MKSILYIAVVFSLIIISEAQSASLTDSVNVTPFGKVFIYKQTTTPQNITIMISGDGGWKSGVISFAETFSEMNTIVIGVDILRYFKELRQRTDECYNVTADFVQLATEIEKKYNFPDYVPPVIMGYSSGATLVYGILAQARPGTFAGGISLGFCPDVELPKMLCQINGLTGKVLVPGKSFLFQPDAKLGNPWVVLQGQQDQICNFTEVEDFVRKTAEAELIPLPKVGHGFSKWSDFMPQWKDAYKKLTKQDKPVSDTTINTGRIKDLPLVITTEKIQSNSAPIALLISGDGGWYGFEQRIADGLAKQGIPTIGLDSKKYFWNRTTPEETAADISKSLSYYSKEWGKKRFLLIGYSLGSEIVPFIVTRLSEEMKAQVNLAVLLSPETTTDFEIHISNMLGMGNRQNTYNVTDEIIKMQSVPTLIIYGEGEKPKIPGLLIGTSVKINYIPGDHHYKFDVPLIIRTMKDNKAF
jgi:type IV secretory pathway VirJ component